MINNFEEELKTSLKSKIKYASGKCAKLLLILGLLSQGIGFLSVFILTGYSMISGNYSYMINKEFTNVMVGIVPCILVDIIVIIIGLKSNKLNLKRDIFKKSSYSKSIIPLGMSAVGGVLLISTTIYSLYSTIIKFNGLTIPAPDFTFPSSILMQIIYILYICILGPTLEEIIFRGILLRTMKKYGAFMTIIFTSIIFSMFHLNLVQFMTPLLLGILLAFVTVKTDSIVPAIIIHIFNNTIATIITCIAGFNEILYIVTLCTFIIGGVLGLIFFINKYKSDFKSMVKEDSKVLSFRKKLAYCFFNRWSICYVIFYIVFILINFASVNIS